MTIKLLRSHLDKLGFDFEQEVKNHIKALEAHRFTMGVAAPSIKHHWVEHAIKRIQYPIKAKRPDDFEADYEIMEDTTLTDAEQRAVLLQQIAAKEHELINGIWSAGQRKLDDIRARKARGKPVEQRTADERSLLQEHAAKSAYVEELAEHAALLMVEVEQLPEASIRAWKMPEWPRFDMAKHAPTDVPGPVVLQLHELLKMPAPHTIEQLPATPLDERKMTLRGGIIRKHVQLKEAIWSDHQYREALKAHNLAFAKRMTARLNDEHAPDPCTPEEAAHIESFTRRAAYVHALGIISHQLQDEVNGLTTDNIDGWQMPEWPSPDDDHRGADPALFRVDR